jgi:hypothetical protein
VTERIALAADPKSEKEMTGLSQSLQTAFGLGKPEEKLGGRQRVYLMGDPFTGTIVLLVLLPPECHAPLLCPNPGRSFKLVRSSRQKNGRIC